MANTYGYLPRKVTGKISNPGQIFATNIFDGGFLSESQIPADKTDDSDFSRYLFGGSCRNGLDVNLANTIASFLVLNSLKQERKEVPGKEGDGRHK